MVRLCGLPLNSDDDLVCAVLVELSLCKIADAVFSCFQIEKLAMRSHSALEQRRKEPGRRLLIGTILSQHVVDGSTGVVTIRLLSWQKSITQEKFSSLQSSGVLGNLSSKLAHFLLSNLVVPRTAVSQQQGLPARSKQEKDD